MRKTLGIVFPTIWEPETGYHQTQCQAQVSSQTSSCHFEGCHFEGCPLRVALGPLVAVACDVAFVQSNLMTFSRMKGDTHEIGEVSLSFIVFYPQRIDEGQQARNSCLRQLFSLSADHARFGRPKFHFEENAFVNVV